MSRRLRRRGLLARHLRPFSRIPCVSKSPVPDRGDLPRARRSSLGMIPRSSEEELLLCVDSDFDYLFAGRTLIERRSPSKFVFHTYAYATGNYLCYAFAAQRLRQRGHQNDTRIFDFVKFMRIFVHDLPAVPLVRLLGAAGTENDTFADRQAVGAHRLPRHRGQRLKDDQWLRRRASRSARTCSASATAVVEPIEGSTRDCQLRERGLTPENAYLFMHGHTLMDNVVLIMLNTVCEKLPRPYRCKITASKKQGVAALRTRCRTTPTRCARSATCCSTTKTTPKPTLQTVGNATSAVYRPHDLEHEAQRRNPRPR